MELLIAIGVLLIVTAVVGLISNLADGGAPLIGFVVLEAVAIPIALLGLAFVVIGVLWR